MDLYTVSPERYDAMREDIIQLLVSKEMNRIERDLVQMMEDTLWQMFARQPDIVLQKAYENLP